MGGAGFSEPELERYARHIVLRELGGAGQIRLKRARVLVVGAGGLGSPVLLYLAAAGVGQLAVVDDDAVALANLQRQVLHGTNDIGRPKTASAAAALARLNPDIRVEPHAMRLGPANAAALVAGCDAVVDGSDSYDTRAAVNAACIAARVPLVGGAVGSWDGMVSVFRPWTGTPCWRCVFPAPAAAGMEPSCSEAGVLGSLTGTIGTLMATECIKLLSGAGTLLEGRLALHDALEAEFRVLEVQRNPDCPACG